MPDVLAHTLLIRPVRASGHTAAGPHSSVDFLINGASLLQLLARAHGGHSDWIGSLGQHAPDSVGTAARLLLQAAPDSPAGRVLLYICPECAHIGCGAYGAAVRRDGDRYVWADFAFENGYEDAQPVTGIGPFVFEAAQYEQAVAAAAAG
jgi:hypothetical protein